MDSRIFLYIALAMSAFLIWQTWTMEHRVDIKPVTQAQVNTGVPQAGVIETKKNDIPDGGGINESPAALAQKQLQSFAEKQKASGAQTISIKTDMLEMLISTRGGDIVSVDLPTYTVSLEDKTPTNLLNPQDYIAQSGLKFVGGKNDKLAPTHHALYQSSKQSYELGDKDTLVVPLFWKNEEGIVVEKRYTFYRGMFTVDIEHIVSNSSVATWKGKQYRQLRRGQPEETGSKLMAQAYVGAAYYDEKFKKLSFKKIGKENLSLEANNTFITMLQHYFISAWIPDPREDKENLYSMNISDAGEEYLIGMMSGAKLIESGQVGSFKSVFYAGPKLQEELKELANGLELTSDYGFLTVIAKPIFWLLKFIHKNIVQNWGWAIILLTVFIKGLFYKLSETSFKSMAKMRKLAPKMQSLKEKYGDDKAGYQKEMMEFYRKEKVNPVGGCFPILIQIPVFISLYWVLMEAVELRQAPWMFWIYDLSIKDPYFVLPVLMGATMLFQHKLNPPQPDPMMQRITQILPLVFTFFFAFFPAGLVLYWVVNSMLSIAQQWYITRRIDRAG